MTRLIKIGWWVEDRLAFNGKSVLRRTAFTALSILSGLTNEHRECVHCAWTTFNTFRSKSWKSVVTCVPQSTISGVPPPPHQCTQNNNVVGNYSFVFIFVKLVKVLHIKVKVLLKGTLHIKRCIWITICQFLAPFVCLSYGRHDFKF